MRVTHLLVHVFLALLFAAGASAATPNMQLYSPYPFRIDHSGTYTPLGTFYAGEEDRRIVWIRNEGDSNLQTNLATVDNQVNCVGGIGSQPVSTIILPGESTTFVILFTPSDRGTWSYRVSLTSNDPSPTTYTFTVTGDAERLPFRSEFELYRPFPTGPIADGGTNRVTGLVAGVATNVEYTIRNEGQSSLSFNRAIQVLNPVNCTVTVVPIPAAGNPLAKLLRTTFSLRITPTLEGAWSFAIKIFSDDADEGIYDVTIVGVATGVPEIAITRGATAIVDGAVTAPGNVLSPLVAGFNSVFTYTVTNTGNGNLTLGSPAYSALTNCTVTTLGPALTSVAPGASGTFQVNVVAAASGAVSFITEIVTNDSSENPSNWLSTGTAIAAEREIAITRGAATIAHTGTDNLFSIPNSTSRAATYMVTNVGYADLTVGAVSVSTPVNCAVVVTQPGATTLAAPANTSLPFTSTTFALTVTPGVDGPFTFAVSVANNDANEAPSTFTVTGTARPDPELGESKPPCGLGSGFTIVMLGTFGLILVGRRRA